MAKKVFLSGFRTVESEEAVTKYLEAKTGEGTVQSVNVLPRKPGALISSAIALFTTAESGGIIIQRADDQRLWYGDSCLKAREFKEYKETVVLKELVKLHFGSMISEEKFSVLWTERNVYVTFEKELNSQMYVHLAFTYDDAKYKLELSSDTICRIELHCPRDQYTKFLHIQLCGAPRIYKEDRAVKSNWVREVDFTPSCSIAQSSSVCLELPFECSLPDPHRTCLLYTENEAHFGLEKGNTFSGKSSLAPIIDPPLGINLPYKLLFKVNSLVQYGIIPGQALDVDFYKLVNPASVRIEYIEYALDKLFNSRECCYEPARWLKKQYAMYEECSRVPRSGAIALDEGCVYVHRVLVTPTKVYFCGPEFNVSNCVLRNFSQDIDNFLRVSFVDEDLGQMRSQDLCPLMRRAEEEERMTRVYERILSVLRDGMVIGDKKFELLAFSASQLRSNSAWMFASRKGLTAQGIRDWMGDFSGIRNVSKHAARLGQSLSSSRKTFRVGTDEIEVIRDVETVQDGTKYCFSDGIGKISAEFAAQVATKCGLSRTPSAFQIRYGSYKGVVAVDPTSSKKLSLRKSMCKFESHNTELCVISWPKYQPCYLNRQLITLLSTLGVPDHVFERKQKQALHQLKEILTNPMTAQQALGLMFQGEFTETLKEMLNCYKPNAEPFVALMLQSYCATKLAELRTKTRIFVQQGRSLMGCLDETGTLEYGQVFVHFFGSRRRQLFDDICINDSLDVSFIIEGKVVVAKNPCLHPGDVRVLEAVDVPELYHMVDCVVFPQKGHRPHPNECSGSDLDGDIYFVCWDPELIPHKQIQPMDYTPAPTLELDHNVTIEDVEEYFVNYIVNDSLGIIANAHTVFADKEYAKAMSQPCIELAKLFSIAVDFPKTGVPAVIPPELYAKEYPDFMEKPDKRTYISENVIGKLFREVKDIAPHDNSITTFTRQVAASCYDPDMEVDGFEAYLDDAFYYKGTYDYKLGNLLDYYGIKTEAEILSGNVMSMSKSFTKRRDSDAINMAVKSLRKEARAWFNEKGTGIDSGGDDVYAKASAWYHVTYHPSYYDLYNEGMNRPHFISFPWCVFDKLGHIKKEKVVEMIEIHDLDLVCDADVDNLEIKDADEAGATKMLVQSAN